MDRTERELARTKKNAEAFCALTRAWAERQALPTQPQAPTETPEKRLNSAQMIRG
jgi:hypothetical protein